jgi:hypothetical protein
LNSVVRVFAAVVPSCNPGVRRLLIPPFPHTSGKTPQPSAVLSSAYGVSCRARAERSRYTSSLAIRPMEHELLWVPRSSSAESTRRLGLLRIAREYTAPLGLTVTSGTIYLPTRANSVISFGSAGMLQRNWSDRKEEAFNLSFMNGAGAEACDGGARGTRARRLDARTRLSVGQRAAARRQPSVADFYGIADSTDARLVPMSASE